MTRERSEYALRDRPIAPIGQNFTPFADYNFRMLEGGKVMDKAEIEHFIDGVEDHIVTTRLSTWLPVGELIDRDFLASWMKWEGKYITPSGLVDASKDKDLAVETLRQNPYVLTVFLRRFDLPESSELDVQAILLGEKGEVVVNSSFGGLTASYFDGEFLNSTVGTLGFTLPKRRTKYPLIMPQDSDFIKENFFLKINPQLK